MIYIYKSIFRHVIVAREKSSEIDIFNPLNSLPLGRYQVFH
ncbi:unnamed protein product [Ixodes persulcatus]